MPQPFRRTLKRRFSKSSIALVSHLRSKHEYQGLRFDPHHQPALLSNKAQDAQIIDIPRRPGTWLLICRASARTRRQPTETRQVYTERFLTLVHQLASALPPETPDPENTAMAMFATLIGSLQLARIVDSPELSARMLKTGAEAALRLVEGQEEATRSDSRAVPGAPVANA